MATKKKHGHAPQKGATYLDKKAAREQALIDAGIACGKQQIVDYLTLVLRDPKYVKKDIHGRKRIELIFVGLHDYERRYEKAYTVDKEADVAQQHLDDELREVYGDDLVPFAERQPDVVQLNYKRRKDWVD